MSLLHFFNPENTARHLVLHVHHGLRACADRDSLFVREQAEIRGLESRTVKLNPKGIRGNVQAWARAERYAAAHDLARRKRFNWIVTAHTGDDCVESVYIQAAQGRGYFRRGRIAPVRGSLIRPLLGWTRQNLRQALHEEGVGWVDDPSNDQESYLRNWVRHNTLASESGQYYRSWSEGAGRRGDTVEAIAHRILMRMTGACAAVCIAVPAAEVDRRLLPVLVQEWLARKNMRIRDDQLLELCNSAHMPATDVQGGVVCRLDHWIWAVSDKERSMLAKRTLDTVKMYPLGFTQSALDKDYSVLRNSCARKGYPESGHFQQGGMTRSAKNVFRMHGIPAFLRADCFWFLRNGNAVFELSVRNRKTPVLLLPCAHTIEDKR